MPKDVIVGQIGCGYWGPNLLRNLTGLDGCRVKTVAETSMERRKFVTSHYPNIAVSADAADVLGDPDVSAVVLATPARTHYELAYSALEAGKHVLVEKPLTLDVSEAGELATLAAARGRVLMVGHTYLYNSALKTLRRNIEDGVIGAPYYFHLNRLNLGIARTDVNAWWNLAPHDVSILLYLRDGKMPVEVSATGAGFIQKDIEDTVFARLAWGDGVVAHIHVSWLNPEKVRRVTLVGSKKMAVLDELAEHPLALYDKGIDLMPAESERRDYDNFDGMQLVHRAGEIIYPDVETREPLADEVSDFISCITGNKTPVSNATQGRNVVAILAAGQESLKNEGRPVAPKT